MCTLSMRPPIPPPNVPQARPIENLWGILAQIVYEGGWEDWRLKVAGVD